MLDRNGASTEILGEIGALRDAARDLVQMAGNPLLSLDNIGGPCSGCGLRDRGQRRTVGRREEVSKTASGGKGPSYAGREREIAGEDAVETGSAGSVARRQAGCSNDTWSWAYGWRILCRSEIGQGGHRLSCRTERCEDASFGDVVCWLQCRNAFTRIIIKQQKDGMYVDN